MAVLKTYDKEHLDAQVSARQQILEATILNAKVTPVKSKAKPKTE